MEKPKHTPSSQTPPTEQQPTQSQQGDLRPKGISREDAMAAAEAWDKMKSGEKSIHISSSDASDRPS